MISSLWVPTKPENVFSLLSNNQAFTELPGLGSVTTLREGFIESEGIGAERLINGKVHEQIIHCDPQQGEIRYRALEGCPLKHYQGEVSITGEGQGSRITWINRYRSPIPGCAWLFNIILKRTFTKVLQAVAAPLATHSTNIGPHSQERQYE